MRIVIYICTILLVGSNVNFSQDTIYFKTGEAKRVWITEKSDKVVKYKLLDAEDSPVIIDKTGRVDKIVFRNGEEMIVSARLKRMPDRHGISAGMMAGLTTESFFYKLHLNYFTKPALNFTIDILKETEDAGGFFAGMKYYYNPEKPGLFNVYSGLSAGAMWDRFVMQVPLGISLAANNGFDLKLGLNAYYVPTGSTYDLYAELLVGWRL